MITGVHTLIYSDDADATRHFLRDVLRWPSLDGGDGWLIFKTGASELGVHPTTVEFSTPDGTHEVYESQRQHQISLMCDELDATIAELAGRGARFTRDARDEGYGLTIELDVPGADPILLYQPRHPLALNLPD